MAFRKRAHNPNHLETLIGRMQTRCTYAPQDGTKNKVTKRRTKYKQNRSVDTKEMHTKLVCQPERANLSLLPNKSDQRADGQGSVPFDVAWTRPVIGLCLYIRLISVQLLIVIS